MATRYSYELQNTKRDLSDVLSTIIAKTPRFISLFGNRPAATNTKHEWLEDSITPRSITVTAVDTLVCTVSQADYDAVQIGTVLRIAGDAAVFQITAKTPATPSVTVALIAANGSSTTTPAANDVLAIISTPQHEGSKNGDGESVLHALGTNYNYTEILRKEAVLSGTTMSVNTYGDVDGNIDNQVKFKLQELAYDMNRMAIWGARVQRTAVVKGMAGGLYAFATTLEKPLTTAAVLDSKVVNDGAELVLAAGGTPDVICCSIGQARNLSADLKDQIQIVQGDPTRGSYVATVINDVTGMPMKIVADYDFIDTEAFVCDSSGFGVSYLQNRGVMDYDTTSDGFDGIQRTITGEVTFEFKNADSRLAKISNLKLA